MANFDETIFPTTPYWSSLAYLTVSGGTYDGGSESTRSARLFPLFHAKLVYQQYLLSDYAALYDFYVSQKGGGGRFTFTDFNGIGDSPVGIQWPKLYVGITDGATTIYDLPMKSSSSFDTAGTPGPNGLYRAGSLLNPPAHASPAYTFSAAGGTDGRDKITLASAGSAGDLLEWRAFGRAAFRCRFVNDSLDFNSFVADVSDTGLEIREVRA